LLSLKSAEVLTSEVRTRIIQVFAAFPWWGVAQVYAHLQAQGQAITERQVRQTAEESGWSQLRQELQRRYHQPESFRPQEDWVVGQLLALVELLAQVSGEPDPAAATGVADLQTLVAATGLTRLPLKALPGCCGWSKWCSASGRRREGQVAAATAALSWCAKVTSPG
jgi:hypothetical protein